MGVHSLRLILHSKEVEFNGELNVDEEAIYIGLFVAICMRYSVRYATLTGCLIVPLEWTSIFVNE